MNVIPSGISGTCLLVLGIFDGEATTTQIREFLEQDGAPLTRQQIHTALHYLTRRRLAEISGQGSPGPLSPTRWRLTGQGRAMLAADDEAAGEYRIPCGIGWPS